MRRIIFFRLGSRDVHLPKLFGAFILCAGVLLLLGSLTTMFDSWESVKAIHACLDAANSGTVAIQECQTQAYYAFGILLRADQFRLTDLQLTSGLLPKIAPVFFWVATIIVGLVFYRSWRLTVPIEEASMRMPEKKWRKR